MRRLSFASEHASFTDPYLQAWELQTPALTIPWREQAQLHSPGDSSRCLNSIQRRRKTSSFLYCLFWSLYCVRHLHHSSIFEGIGWSESSASLSFFSMRYWESSSFQGTFYFVLVRNELADFDLSLPIPFYFCNRGLWQLQNQSYLQVHYCHRQPLPRTARSYWNCKHYQPRINLALCSSWNHWCTSSSIWNDMNHRKVKQWLASGHYTGYANSSSSLSSYRRLSRASNHYCL